MRTPRSAVIAAVISLAAVAAAQAQTRRDDAYRPPAGTTGQFGSQYESDPSSSRRGYESSDSYRAPPSGSGGSDAYRPPAQGQDYGTANADRRYRAPAQEGDGGVYYPPRRSQGGGDGQYGTPYSAPAPDDDDAGPPPPRDRRYADEGPPDRRTYSQNEIMQAGHGFFGSVSRGLANVVEYAFQKAGRPNGYILGEDAGGAFVAGLRYGEGVLHTKDAGAHKVYWQGPSVGYDFGGEGSKTMVLVYNLRDPAEIYDRFGGIQGSAYLVGGVSIQFQKNNDVVLAPIRSGVGLRLGANVGYLKYTRRPTWNPF